MRRTDDFPTATKIKLAKRVNYHCSNPNCDRPTSGAKSYTKDGTVSIGVAAHITAASQNGPRFDSTIPSAMRSSIENAIWLCQLCATLIDKDPKKFSAITLGEWKLKAESKYGMDLENRYPTANELVDPEQTAAENDILLGAIDGYEGNMIVFGERNGWDTVNLVGENYDTSQIERSLYVQAILNLMESGHVQRRGTDRAYELTFKGLKRAYALRDSGGHRRQPGQIV